MAKKPSHREIWFGDAAFPRPAVYGPDSYGEPELFEEGQDGMALVDWFAGQALLGLMMQHRITPLPYDVLANEAYRIAEAMVVERIQATEQGGASNG